MTRLGLTINEAKTSVKDARTEGFDFLDTLGPKFPPTGGQKYLGASPSTKSVQRIKDKIGDLLQPGERGSWPQVRNRLNRLLAGWSGYFSFGTRVPAYRAIDHHVSESVRHFLAKRSLEEERVGFPGSRFMENSASLNSCVLGADGLGDDSLRAHGTNRDDVSFDRQLFQENGHRRDLVAFVVHFMLTQNYARLIFYTAKSQDIDYKRQLALEKRLGTTFR